jgi:hypothetical protein
MKYVKTFEMFESESMNEALNLGAAKESAKKFLEAIFKHAAEGKSPAIAELSAKIQDKMKTLSKADINMLAKMDPAGAEEAINKVVKDVPVKDMKTAEKVLRESFSVEEELLEEGFVQKVIGGIIKYSGIAASGGAFLSLVFALVRAALAEDGLIDKVKAFYPAGMPIGVFCAICCGVLVGGGLVTLMGKAVQKSA